MRERKREREKEKRKRKRQREKKTEQKKKEKEKETGGGLFDLLFKTNKLFSPAQMFEQTKPSIWLT